MFAVRSYLTKGQWLEIDASENLQPGEQDPGRQELGRILSQTIRSPNLVVLAGLGTSLCVVDDAGTKLAPTMSTLLSDVRQSLSSVTGDDGTTAWSELLELARVQQSSDDLEGMLSRLKIATEFLGDIESARADTILGYAESVIRDKVDFLSDEISLSVHEAFLRRVGRRSSRQSRAKIFTTNYDLCFEVAAARNDFMIVDGFGFGSSRFSYNNFQYDVVRRSDGDDRPEFVENLLHLYKLHGSIDWALNSDGSVERRRHPDRPLLVYPRSTKYEMSFSQPYIELMGAFQASLRNQNVTVFVVGFGFNDKHLAEPLIAAARANLALNIVVVDPALDAKTQRNSTSAYHKTLVELVDAGDARVSLISGRFEDVVPLIPDVVAETELERHTERFRRAGVSK